MPEKGVVQRLIRISDSTVPAFSPIVCRYRAARYASVEGYGETQRQRSDSQLETRKNWVVESDSTVTDGQFQHFGVFPARV